MALSPEKNDVDIRSLFEYRKPVTIHGHSGKKVTLYMRVIGDAELQKARVKALRESRKLRDALKDRTSDEYLAYIPDISEAEKEKIVELLLMTEIKTLAKEISDEFEFPFPQEPSSDASLEEQEQYQKEVDEYPKKREKRIQKEVIKRAEKVKERLLEKTKKELLEQYEKTLIQEMCEIEMTQTFYDYVVYYSLYKTENYKIRVFDSFEDYNNLPSDVKDHLLEEYRDLELGIDELKK